MCDDVPTLSIKSYFVFNPFQFDEKNFESILRAKKLKSDFFFQILTGFFKDFVHQQFETKTENLNSGRSKINKIRHEIFLVKMKKILNMLIAQLTHRVFS